MENDVLKNPGDKNKIPLIIISGATGVGKTELSISLAKSVNGEIISADSMQVYRKFDIGTAKITPEEMSGVPHHLIDILEPDQEFNIYEFKRYTRSAIEKIVSRGHIPIIVGGTGFYIQSVLYDIQFDEESGDKAYRESLEQLARDKGAEYLHEMLKNVDPDSAEAIHPNNVKRVIRALEYYNETGEQISVHNSREKDRVSPYNFAYFVLNRDRNTIYERINRRVDMMMEAGLAEEVRGLLDQGVDPSWQSMQGIGYKEIVPYIRGDVTLDSAVETLKQNTRHFAKRQNTWFKREKDVCWVNYEDFQDNAQMLEFLVNYVKGRGILNV